MSKRVGLQNHLSMWYYTRRWQIRFLCAPHDCSNSSPWLIFFKSMQMWRDIITSLHRRLLRPFISSFALAATFSSVKTHYVHLLLIHSLIIFSEFMITSVLETCTIARQYFCLWCLLYSKFNHAVFPITYHKSYWLLIKCHTLPK